MECCSPYTISDYLKGVVRGFSPSDEACESICQNAGIESPVTSYYDLTNQQKRIALAYLYVWIATGPSSTAKWSEKDGDWSQSGGGEQLTATQIRMFLRWADNIFKEYGLPTVGMEKFGMRKGGFHNVRNYNPTGVCQ